MDKVKCVNCGKEKEFDSTRVSNYEENGFNVVFDVSTGLTTIPLCGECYAEVQEHAKAIEAIVKKEMWSIQL